MPQSRHASDDRGWYALTMIHDPELPGCFSNADLIFASYELDRRRAFAWLATLREREMQWSDVRVQIEEYLRSRNAAVFHIVDQIDQARRMLAPWLFGPAGEE